MSVVVTLSLFCNYCGLDKDTYHDNPPEILKIFTENTVDSIFNAIEEMAREEGKKRGWVSRKGVNPEKTRDVCPKCVKELELKL